MTTRRKPTRRTIAPAPFAAPRGKWTTKDGTTLAIRDMTDAHLQYAVRSMERAARRELMAIGFSAGYYSDDHHSIGGDAAAQVSDEAFGAAEAPEYHAGELYPKYDELRAEMDRRGIERIEDVP
jgi:hypothetical protein